MLQKLENAYLAILRFVIIAAAGILLVAVFILGFNSFKAIQFKPVAQEITPKVSESELIKGITNKTTLRENESNSNTAKTSKVDPNAAYYERTANAVSTFVAKYSGGTESAEKSQVALITKNRAESFSDPKLVAAFAKGFAESIEITLADPSVIETAKTTSALIVVNKALNIFERNFKEQVEKEHEQFAAKQKEYFAKKAEGMQSLYIAAGAFMAFLIIVFLSIIVRIERNLRHLENKPVITA